MTPLQHEFPFPDARDVTIAEQAGTISELMTLVKEQQETIVQLEAKLAKQEALLASQVKAKSSTAPAITENYSLDRNKTSEKKPRKKSTGRKPSDAKRHLVTDTINVFADAVDKAKCVLHRSQFAWRMADGKAVYLRYDIYDLPHSTDLPLPSGVRTNRSEFGIEITLILAFLPKSQADSLFSQLATDWNEQYDTTAELMAL